MTVKTNTRIQVSGKDQSALQDEPVEGVVLEADYAEDRPISLLAKRQREFQQSLQTQYIDTEMPAS
ncbi:MAG: hypothetical protein ACRYFS_09690 [Janthinobacterium lividum]